jgi:hypothetical protein
MSQSAHLYPERGTQQRNDGSSARHGTDGDPGVGDPQSQRRQLIFTDKIIADHAAVDTTPPMKAGARTGLLIDAVITDGKILASWAVHH